MKMNQKEISTLIHAVLDMDDTMEVRTFVVVAHTHRIGEECGGGIRVAGTTEDVPDTVSMLMAAIQSTLEQEGLQMPEECPEYPPITPDDWPDPTGE